jgi:hypothetical protein
MADTVADEENIGVKSEYMVNGVRFIVAPVFKDGGSETIKSVLLRLIKSEVERD